MREQSFPVDEIVVERPKHEPPEDIDELGGTAAKQLEGVAEPPHSEAWEAAATGLKLGGTAVGTVLEETAYEFTGLVGEVAGIFIAYGYTLAHAVTQREEGGDLEGSLWGLLAANSSVNSGGLVDMDPDHFYTLVMDSPQARRDLRAELVGLKREGGTAGVWTRFEGRRRGSDRVIATLHEVTRRYRRYRLAHKGELGTDPKKEIAALQRQVLDKMMEVLPELQKARAHLRE